MGMRPYTVLRASVSHLLVHRSQIRHVQLSMSALPRVAPLPSPEPEPKAFPPSSTSTSTGAIKIKINPVDDGFGTTRYVVPVPTATGPLPCPPFCGARTVPRRPAASVIGRLVPRSCEREGPERKKLPTITDTFHGIIARRFRGLPVLLSCPCAT